MSTVVVAGTWPWRYFLLGAIWESALDISYSAWLRRLMIPIEILTKFYARRSFLHVSPCSPISESTHRSRRQLYEAQMARQVEAMPFFKTFRKNKLDDALHCVIRGTQHIDSAPQLDIRLRHRAIRSISFLISTSLGLRRNASPIAPSA